MKRFLMRLVPGLKKSEEGLALAPTDWRGRPLDDGPQDSWPPGPAPDYDTLKVALPDHLVRRAETAE